MNKDSLNHGAFFKNHVNTWGYYIYSLETLGFSGNREGHGTKMRKIIQESTLH